MTRMLIDARQRRPSARGRTILLFDESIQRGFAYADAMLTLGYHTDMASLAVDALAKALRGRPDVVVIDGDARDARALVVALAADPRTRTLPILAFRADGRPPPWSASAPCRVTLPKPCSPAELAQAVARVLVEDAGLVVAATGSDQA